MPVFFRLNEKGFSWAGEVENLGFSEKDPRYIPTEYLEKGEFLLFRMANGFGDWGILSAMPRLLKEKYPHCKVYLPSEKLIKEFNSFMSLNSIVIFIWKNPRRRNYCLSSMI